MYLITLTEQEIICTFLAIAVLLLFSFVCGRLFELIKAPKVVGEIIGGILLGNTFLSYLFPDILNNIFKGYAEEGKVLNIFYQLGLCLLMFSSGYNTKIRIEKKYSRIFVALFVGSTIIPMLLALGFAKNFEKYFIGEAGSTKAYVLVFIIGVAITSIPVISKIFFDLGIIETKFANIVLTASTLQDLCLWILLNVTIDISKSDEYSVARLLSTAFITILLFVIVVIFERCISKFKIYLGENSFLQFSLITLFIFVALIGLLGINIMYSSFIVGYLIKCISYESIAKEKVKCISDFAFSFFVPIYFALVGIQLDLLHGFPFFRFIYFFIIAFLLEGIGTVLILKSFTKLNNKIVVDFGVAMNARGGPGIVLATVAYSNRIINIEFFTVLILTTMISSLIAGYWLRREQSIDDSVFEDL